MTTDLGKTEFLFLPPREIHLRLTRKSEHWFADGTLFESIPRTDDSIESWHDGFASTLNASRPKIWKCVLMHSKKKRAQCERRQKRRFLENTISTKRKYNDHAERILKVCDD